MHISVTIAQQLQYVRMLSASHYCYHSRPAAFPQRQADKDHRHIFIIVYDAQDPSKSSQGHKRCSFLLIIAPISQGSILCKRPAR